MKKKFSLWLNIVTICLCICAIAIGVYAATTATLTVSGTIGFEAHGCTGTVSGTIVGHAQKENDEGTMVDHNDGMPVETPVSLGEAVNFGQTLSYGSRYFSDLATTDGSITPIALELTVTNTSLFPIEGQLVLPETEFAKAIDFDVESGLIQLAPTNTTDDKDVGTITITMKLKETTTNYTTPVDLNFTVKFNKYAQVKHDAATGYYMTMGSNVVTNAQGYQQVEAVKWIPFAENNGTQFVAFDNTNKPDATKEHYWISEKVLDIGTTTVIGSGSNQYTDDSGVPFNPYLDAYGKDTRTELASQNACIYLASNIRDLLQGEDAYKSSVITDFESLSSAPGAEKVNLFTEYGITGYVYDQIDTRTAEDLYGSDTIPAVLSAYNTDNDKLWLLSGEELNLLLNKTTDEFYYANYPQSDELKTQTLRQGVNSDWWLRSPYYGSTEWSVTSKGDLWDSMVFGSLGIRPAFKI